MSSSAYIPLAEQLRPKTLEEFVGQLHILGEQKPLTNAIQAGKPHSMLFWGPPGTGKTTLARMLAERCDHHFVSLSAILDGVKEVRAAVAKAQQWLAEDGRGTLVFVDEVHRFNKAQQDAFLPFVENGTILFVGATTENPSFEVNRALLSRARVYQLQALSAEQIAAVLHKATQRLNMDSINSAQLGLLATAADGDCRRALNLLELCLETSGGQALNDAQLKDIIQGGQKRFDKGGDYFYDQISALHKSIRGSAPDASLYWFQRMVDGGTDPKYLARRLLRIASEDIGNADPRALEVCVNAWNAFERLGSPEGELALAQAVTYLACAPKSNAVYMAYKASARLVKETGSLEVPKHLRNAPTKLMNEQGYGDQYRYAHNEPDAYAAGENYFPDELRGTRYYHPVPRGLEIKIGEKLQRLAAKDSAAK